MIYKIQRQNANQQCSSFVPNEERNKSQGRSNSSLGTGIINDLLERVRSETDTIGAKELVLELDPVKTEGVKEALKDIHHEKNAERDASEDAVADEGCEPVNVEGGNHGLLPEDGGKLGVGKRKSPKTKVGSGVGNHTQDELDGLDGLVDDDLTEAVLVVFLSLAMFLVIVGVVVDGVLVLLGKEVRLGKEQNGNGGEGDKEKDVLDTGLSVVNGLVDIAGLKSNVDQGSDKVGRLATVARSAKVERALVGRGRLIGTVISPGSAETIALSSALGPDTALSVDAFLVVFAAPAIAIGLKAGGGKHSRVPVDAPLHENENNHVNEKGGGEGNHGKELEEEVELLLEVDGIQTLEAGTSKHLNNSKDDTELHLEGVEEKKLVGGYVPHGIETEGVHRLSGTILGGLDGNSTLLDLSVVLTIKDPSRSEEVEAKGEHIVVNETSVNGEEAHHGDHVATSVEAGSHLAELGLVVGLLVPEEVKTGAEEEETVADISVHDTEEEGEGSSGEEGGVGLPIPGNTVGVDELLVAVGELVGGEVGGRGRPGLGDLLDVGGHVGVHAGVGTSDGLADVGGRLGDDPSLATEHARDVGLEHVEGVVDGLLADDDPGPALGVAGEHLAQAEAGVLVLEKDGAGVDKLLGILGEHAIDGRGVVHVGEGVAMSIEGVADLLELGLDGDGLVEDDEDALPDELAGGGVGDGLLDGGETDVAVTAGGTEDHSLEASLLLSGNHASDGGEAHVHVTGGTGGVLGSEKALGLVVSGTGRLGSAGGHLRNGQTGGIGHEKAAGLLEDLLQLDLLVVLGRELLAVRVELLELVLVSLELGLERLEELSAGLVLGGSSGGTRGGGVLEEGIDISGRLEGEVELVALTGEVAELALELIATLDVADEATLERGEVGVQLLLVS